MEPGNFPIQPEVNLNDHASSSSSGANLGENVRKLNTVKSFRLD